MITEQSMKISTWLEQECDNCGTKSPEHCGCNDVAIGSGSITDYSDDLKAMGLLRLLMTKHSDFWYEIKLMDYGCEITLWSCDHTQEAYSYESSFSKAVQTLVVSYIDSIDDLEI